MAKKRDGSVFVGYIANGTVITQELLDDIKRGSVARQPYDIDLKANPPTTEYQRLDFGKLD